MKPVPIWIVGVDPGERWVGFARLRISPRGAYKADTGVLDASHYSFTGLVDRLLNLSHVDAVTSVVTEEYRQRAVGHQRFAKGHTSQLIGAIRYGAEKQGAIWSEVSAADPDKELPRFPIHPYLERWRTWWPDPRNPSWHHARSAWRVLAQRMLTHEPDLLGALQRRILPTLVPSAHGLPHYDDIDRVAPTLTWNLHETRTPRTNAQA